MRKLLKKARNAALDRPIAQRGVRGAANAGLLPASLLLRIRPIGVHTISTPGGREILYRAEDWDQLARKVVWPLGWEATSLRVFSALCRDASLVVDAGAYTGVYSLIACADSDARVVGFEPNPSVARGLRQNVEINGLEDRVEVVEAAVSNSSGRATLSVPQDITAASLAENGIGEEVALVTLDEVLADRHVDLVKLDVEGNELKALQGARRLLASSPDLIVELLSEAAFDEVSQYLRSFGYETVRHLSREGPQEVTAKAESHGHANYHFVSPNRGGARSAFSG